MPRAKKGGSKPTDTIEALHKPVLPTPPVRDPGHEALLTTILRMGEALAGPLCQAHATDLTVVPAVPLSQNTGAMAGEFAELREVAGWIAGLRGQDSPLATLMSELPEAFGSENAFSFLFRNLFPVRPPVPQPGSDGKPLLTPREVKVLEHVAGDHPHERIGIELGIATSTVNTILRNVYRKLGVHRPFQAVSIAAAKGYLHWDTVTHKIAFARGYTRGNSALIEDFCLNVCYCIPESKDSEFDCLAEFGLLLLTISGAAKRQLHGDRTSEPPKRGAICEVSAQGKIGKPFGIDVIGSARSITVAPALAAQQGFTPGNLFIAHDLKPQRNLNRGAISEFTPNGDYVRTFCGSSEVGTRIIGGLSIAFASDGRLLAASGTWTDAVLAFSDGGAMVERFVEGAYYQIAVDTQGHLYGAQHWQGNGVLRHFSMDGQPVSAFGQRTEGGMNYYSLTVNAQGRVFAGRGNLERRFVDEFDADGQFVREHLIAGYHGSHLTVDSEERLYVPCSRTGDLKILTAEGQILRTIALPASLYPCAVTVSPEGRIWVCGIAV